MKLLILGGSGFVSRYVVEEALQQGHEVWCVTRGMRNFPVGVQQIIADRNNIAVLSDSIRRLNTRFDAILDCICFTPEQAETDIAVLSAFSDRFVVISTDSVYDPDNVQQPRDERITTYMQDNSYGGMKRKMEQVFEKQDNEIKWTLFRPPHIYGAGSQLGCFPMHTRQKDLLAHMLAGKPISLVGGGKYLLQPLYAGDLAKAMIACINNPKSYHEIFCIAGPDIITNRAYFETLGRILNVPVHFEDISEDVFQKESDVAYLYLCNRTYNLSKLCNAGLPVPEIGLEAGLQDQITWLKEQ